MATVMTLLTNFVDATKDYDNFPADYIAVDLTNDYLIWTAGDSVVKDLMTHEPTSDELNAAATIIDDSLDTTVALCLLMDYSHDVGGSYYTHKIIGMSENKQYVFCFYFNGTTGTATIPRLEAWDTSSHTTIDKNVLGLSVPANSMIKAIRTTDSLPGTGWIGTSIAGAANYLELDTAARSYSTQVYANIKIVIPAAYATPSAETFVLTVRYTYL